MLLGAQSQPLDPKISKKFESETKYESELITKKKIKAQRIGKMFDDIYEERKFSLMTLIKWKWWNIKDWFSNFKYTIRNHIKWHKTMRALRPWAGFDGLIHVMQTHLKDYAETEKQYGHATEEYKNQKIESVRETITLLERMQDPHEYTSRRRNEVEAKYPKYESLITEYEDGGGCYSGYFVAQSGGWTGIESGKNPRIGYFEFVQDQFELADSPDQRETDRLLEELQEYRKEIGIAYEQAETDSDNDFENLGLLLKENLYTWWD